MRDAGFTVPLARSRIEWFGDRAELVDALGDLVRRGEPVAVVEVTEVQVWPFDEVDEAFARDEGEGDRSRQLSRTMPVICRRFRLLYAVGESGVQPPSGP